MPIGKVRGFVRGISLFPVYDRGTDKPPKHKQVESMIDKEANDSITLTGSACDGKSIVSVSISHDGGMAIVVNRNEREALVVTVPAVDVELPMRIQTGSVFHTRIEALPT